MAVPDVVDLCRALVRAPSVGDVHGEAAVVAELVRCFAGVAGCAVEIVEPAPGRPSLLCTLDSGRPGPTVLLNGHADTVAPGEGWTHDPYGGRVDHRRLWGLGASDMKGGLAAIACATLRLAARGGPPAGRLLLAATADEDAGMAWGVPWLAARGLLDADAAIVAEACGVATDFDALPIAVRGYAYVEVEVRSPPHAHASLYDPARPHAVAVASELVLAIERELRPAPTTHPLYPGGPTVVAGYELAGGEALGRLPERATFSVGARLLPGADAPAFLDELAAFARARASGCEIVVRPCEPSPFAPGMELDPAHPLVSLASAAVQAVVGAGPAVGGWPGFSEAAFLAARGIPTLPALGPGLIALAHGPDEWVGVEALRRAVAVYDDLLDRLLRPDTPIAS